MLIFKLVSVMTRVLLFLGVIMMPKKDKTQIISEAVYNLLTMFQSGNFPTQLATTIIRRHEGDIVPSDNWSIGNQLLMQSQNTSDARGYKQWQAIGRQVSKGSKAVYIFAPMTKKVKDKEESEKKGEDVFKVVILGFFPIPVFRFEDTTGEPLPFAESYKPKKYPPFFDVAQKLGLTVEYAPMRGDFLGRFSLRTNKIQLCSQDYCVYYHELAHACHSTFEDISAVDNDKCEIIAEFTACVLCELTGISGYQSQGWRYIKKYCDKDDKPEAVLKKIKGVLSDVEKIVNLVLDTADKDYPIQTELSFG